MSVYGNIITENSNESIDNICNEINIMCLEMSNYSTFIDEFILEGNIEILNEGVKEVFKRIKDRVIKLFKKALKFIKEKIAIRKQKIQINKLKKDPYVNDESFTCLFTSLGFKAYGDYNEKELLEPIPINKELFDYPKFLNDYMGYCFREVLPMYDEYISMLKELKQTPEKELKQAKIDDFVQSISGNNIDVPVSIDDPVYRLYNINTMHDLYLLQPKMKIDLIFGGSDYSSDGYNRNSIYSKFIDQLIKKLDTCIKIIDNIDMKWASYELGSKRLTGIVKRINLILGQYGAKIANLNFIVKFETELAKSNQQEKYLYNMVYKLGKKFGEVKPKQ